MKLKIRDIYLRAAKRIARGEHEFSCNAIYNRRERDSKLKGLARDLYSRTMGHNIGYLTIGLIEVGALAPSGSIQAREFRTWLLCMMAACCNDVSLEDDDA
jgi:hypothetical protein